MPIVHFIILFTQGQVSIQRERSPKAKLYNKGTLIPEECSWGFGEGGSVSQPYYQSLVWNCVEQYVMLFNKGTLLLDKFLEERSVSNSTWYKIAADPIAAQSTRPFSLMKGRTRPPLSIVRRIYYYLLLGGRIELWLPVIHALYCNQTWSANPPTEVAAIKWLMAGSIIIQYWEVERWQTKKNNH